MTGGEDIDIFRGVNIEGGGRKGLGLRGKLKILAVIEGFCKYCGIFVE